VCFSNLKFARQDEPPYDANFKFGTLEIAYVGLAQVTFCYWIARKDREMTCSFARALSLFSLAVFLAPGAQAQSLQVIGQSGILGEWELTATVSETAPGRNGEFSGPLTLKHTGLCTQDGPEEKTGQLRFQLSKSSTRMTATLAVDGVVCSYTGKKSDAFKGVLSCPDRRDVPLLIWLK
jgi:hypothetical protein